MAFIQIIEMRTDKVDEITALVEEYRKATEGRSTVQRSIVTQDRNDPKRHMVIVFFDSYEAAMENSNLPETGALAEKQAAYLEGPPTFHDLDVTVELL
jgi:quinol monooxygenase YgiN